MISRRLSILSDMRFLLLGRHFEMDRFLTKLLLANRTTRNGFYFLLNRPGLPSAREFGCAASC
jgi:hypothetical protein